MNFEDEFVTHGKIDFFDLAILKKYGSKSGVVDFGIVKDAVVKPTVNKGNAY
ncbi:hypothetical protein GCM10008015_27750 [Flavobacterium palustre]|uniref:Uncharacterized protein n=1 Tax=Flavobacterium palustre TaxID=1476463 RepID=A0ABQ1HPV8_9FLAO|nr:hypothetical protein GCM10008015_27750 [Flavobacterium palustre]